MHKNLNYWYINLFITITMMISLLSFLPMKLISNYGVHYILLVLIIPLAMFFITPLWLKFKKKTSNHQVLKIESLLLVFTTALSMYILYMDHFRFIELLLGFSFVLLGATLAGIVPITIEVIKSYNIKNSLKNKTVLVTSLNFLFIWVPYILDYFIKDIEWLWMINILFFAILGLINWIIYMSNKNIMEEGNVLSFDKTQWIKVKKNKKFVSLIFIQNYFVGVMKFIEFSLPLLFLLRFEDKKLFFDFSSLLNIKFILLIVGAYTFKFFMSFIAKNIRLNKEKFEMINKISLVMFSLIFLSLAPLAYFGLAAADKHNIIWNVSLFIGAGILSMFYSLIEVTKPSIYRKIVTEKGFSLAMILDHVLGNAGYSIFISFIFLSIIIYTPLTLIMITSVLSALFVVSFLLSIINFILLRNNVKIDEGNINHGNDKVNRTNKSTK